MMLTLDFCPLLRMIEVDSSCVIGTNETIHFPGAR